MGLPITVFPNLPDPVMELLSSHPIAAAGLFSIVIIGLITVFLLEARKGKPTPGKH
jgi:hypothetical protein